MKARFPGIGTLRSENPMEFNVATEYVQPSRRASTSAFGPTQRPDAGTHEETKADDGSNCHPSYDPCLPIVDDLDCADVRAMGKAPVRVKGPDESRLDADYDGLGFE
jgi:hypothetical protein